MFEQFSTKQVAISFWFADWLRESREFSGPTTDRRKKTNPILRSRHKKKKTDRSAGNAIDQDSFGFSFASDWLREWNEFS